MEPAAASFPDYDELGHRLRVAIRAAASVRRISIAELGRRSGIGEQKLRDRLDDEGVKPPTRLSVEETAALAAVLSVPLTSLIRYAEEGGDLPLPPNAYNPRCVDLHLLPARDPQMELALSVPFRPRSV